MSSLENWSKENYIPYTPESKHYISIAREMKKLAEMDGELIDSESDKRFVALAKEVEEAGERGYLYPEDKKKLMERFLSSIRAYKGWAKKIARIGVLAGVLSNAMPANVSEKVVERPDIPSVERVLKLEEETKTTKQGTPWYKGWRLNQVVLERDKNGNLVFNPWGLIFPVQVEKVTDNKTLESLKFNVPQEYARLFDTAKPLRPEDYERVKNYVDKELQRVFEDKLRGLNFSIETRQEVGEGEKKVPQIREVAVSGFASPEGPQQRGPQTLEPGRIDEENIKLARLRAEKALDITVENLEKIGVPKEIIDQSLKEIKGEELQFTTEEYGRLAVLSQKWPGATPLEKIFNMVVDYNDGKIKDPNIVKDLHQILASKRRVEIEIKIEGGEKTIYAVPVPLLLGLLPFIRRRKKGEEPYPEPYPEPAPEPSPEPSPEPIKPEPLPTKPEEDEDFPRKVKVALCDDLYYFFDNPDTIRRGLNYRELCDKMLRDFDRFESDYDREQYLARELLRLWREHDIVARREAGWSEDNIEYGLDYENQPNQMLWALAHTKVLLRLVKSKKELKDKGEEVDYTNLMSRDIESYMTEKIQEIGEETPERSGDWLKTARELAMEGRIAWKEDKIVYE